MESVVKSLFSFLILFIPLPFFLISLANGNFVHLFKELAFSFIDLCCCFLHLYFIYFCYDLYDFFPFTNFGFCLFSFSSCFRCKDRLFEIFLVS